jgi:hypothetical protein
MEASTEHGHNSTTCFGADIGTHTVHFKLVVERNTAADNSIAEVWDPH